jgi:uncharacterized protein YyaL (SSP411 family)
MRHPGGGFYSATDADSEGEEGKYFVWTPNEVRALLAGDDAEMVCQYWGITDAGNFEGGSIPHVARDLTEVAHRAGKTPDEAAAAIERARDVLYRARLERVPPLRDEKIIVSWNALMISALVEAGRVLDVPRYTRAAEDAAEFLWSSLRPEGRLLHVWAAGTAKHPAFLDDHALLAGACLDLYESTGARHHVDRAVVLASELNRRFHDPRGGYFFTPVEGETLISRSKSGIDGATPAGNPVAALVHLRLHALTGDEGQRARAEEILRLYHDAAREQPFAYTTHLEALEFLLDTPVEVVVVGRPDDPVTRALWEAVARTYLPERVLVRASPDDPTPPAPARDRPARDGHATAYVCRNYTCSEPTHDPARLEHLLRAAITRP